MKLSTTLCAVPAIVFLAALPVTAQEHKTPTAPADSTALNHTQGAAIAFACLTRIAFARASILVASSVRPVFRSRLA